MELKKLPKKITDFLGKYRYAALILLIGLALMLIPGNKGEESVPEETVQGAQQYSEEEKLAEILNSIKGAGRVEVLLSIATGEQTIYQTDTDSGTGTQRTDTVMITDADRNQTGLVSQVIPPVYQGAIIVCQGADDPSVRLAIVDAVSKYTGLGANQISVLEMK